MTPEKASKHTFFYRLTMLVGMGILTGLTGWMGSNLVPYINDYFKQKEVEHSERVMIIKIVRADSNLLANHLRYDVIRDSIENQKWMADDADKSDMKKSIESIQNIDLSMLNTISSIQNRISNKNYLLDCDE